MLFLIYPSQEARPVGSLSGCFVIAERHPRVNGIRKQGGNIGRLCVPHRNTPGTVHNQVKHFGIAIDDIYAVLIIGVGQYFFKVPITGGQEPHKPNQKSRNTR